MTIRAHLSDIKKGAKFLLQIPDPLPIWIKEEQFAPLQFDLENLKRQKHQIITLLGSRYFIKDVIFCDIEETIDGRYRSVPLDWLAHLDFKIGTKYQVKLPEKLPNWVSGQKNNCGWAKVLKDFDEKIVTIWNFKKPYQHAWIKDNSVKLASVEETKYSFCLDWLVPISEETLMPKIDDTGAIPKPKKYNFSKFIPGAQFIFNLPNPKPVWFTNGWGEDLYRLDKKIVTLQSDPWKSTGLEFVSASIDERRHSICLDWLTPIPEKEPIEFIPGTKFQFNLPDPVPDWLSRYSYTCWLENLHKVDKKIVTIKRDTQFKGFSPETNHLEEFIFIEESSYWVPKGWLTPIKLHPKIPLFGEPIDFIPGGHFKCEYGQEDTKQIREKAEAHQEETISALQNELKIVREERDQYKKDLHALTTDHNYYEQGFRNQGTTLNLLRDALLKTQMEKKTLYQELLDIQGQLSLTQAQVAMLDKPRIQNPKTSNFLLRIWNRKPDLSGFCKKAVQGIKSVKTKSAASVWKVQECLLTSWRHTDGIEAILTGSFAAIIELIIIGLISAHYINETSRLTQESLKPQPIIVRVNPGESLPVFINNAASSESPEIIVTHPKKPITPEKHFR